MNDDDFRALIEIVQAEARASDAADVANDRHYVSRNSDTEDVRMLPPPKHLIAMLEALGRLMAVRDRATYNHSLARIRYHLHGEGPTGAFVTQTTGDSERSEVNLADTPELSNLRRDLAILIGRLREEDAVPPVTR